MREFIGIIPAAGTGSRLNPFSYPKELIPIFFIKDAGQDKLYPKVVGEYSILGMKAAGVDRCLVVISDQKTEIMKYFSNGSAFGLPIAYVHQERPNGLPHAINSGYEWYKECNVCLALPDTIYYPYNAISILKNEFEAAGADIMLGIFPTEHPEQLGPVRFDKNGHVIEILDKPKVTDLRHAWGLAAWSPAFSLLMHEFLAESEENYKPPLGFIFQRALEKGLKVRAHFFEDGKYFDMGTPDGLYVVAKDSTVIDAF